MSLAAAEVDAALRRNDRFLLEIVEAHGICPFAHATRTRDRLVREVLEPMDAEQLASRVRAHDDGGAEIGLLILPGFTGDARAFERLVDEVRRADEAMRPPVFALAPFHPDTPYHADTPSRLVGLFRRSPDPTIQLVRFATLDAAKRRAPDGKFFFDGSPASWAALAARPERGLSDQITHDNFDRLAARTDELAAALAALSARRSAP